MSDAASLDALDRLFRPKTIAMVGASNSRSRIGGMLFSALSAHFEGALYPVNPKDKEVQGVRAYARLADIADRIDLVVIAVPAEAAIGVLEEAAAVGVGGAVVVTSGFAETGENGQALQDRLADVARRAGVRLIGPNCIGFLNVAMGVSANFALFPGRPLPKPGPVALISQSGGFGSYLLSKGLDTGLKLGWFISTGNEADVNIAMALRNLVERPEVGVLLTFAETLRDPELFIEAAARAHQLGKPIVLLKAGRSEEAARAAMSHTASIVGSADVLDAVCRQYGVIVADTMEHMLDLGIIFQNGRRPGGRNVGIVTASGGAGVLMSDEAALCGLAVPELPQAEQDALVNLVPSPFYGNLSNPIDTTAQIAARPEAMTLIYDQLATSPTLDMLTSVIWGEDDESQEILIDLFHKTDKPIAVLSTGQASLLNEAGVPAFTDPNRLMKALSALVEVSTRVVLPDLAARVADPARAERARAHLALPEGEYVMMEHQGKRLFAEYAIPVTRERLVQGADAAAAAAEEIGGKVVIKAMAYALPHKSDAGALRLGLEGVDQVRKGHDAMLAEVARLAPGATVEGVLVQEMLPARMELTCGLQRDPVFGPMVALGLGGVLIEQIAETVLLRPPFDRQMALDAIASLLGGRLVQGRRGLSDAEQAQLADIMLGVGQLALDLPELAEIDINPIRVDEGRAIAADALVVLAGGLSGAPASIEAHYG